MRTLDIEHTDGTTDQLSILAGSISNKYQKQKHAVVEVLREEWEPILADIDKVNDDVYIRQDGDHEFGGRLVNYNNKKSIVEVELGSFEEDAIDNKPVEGTLPAVGVSDSTVVNNAIDGSGSYNEIPSLTAGTIETLSNDVSFVFSNNSSAGIIRQAQETTGAFIEYDGNAKEINYEEYPYGDTASITIGPQQDNVQDDFKVTEKEREEFTHLRVLGASDGNSQITAEGEIPSYDGTGRERWRKYTNKDITREDRAQEVLDKMLAEYDDSPTRIEIETTVFGEDLNLGTPVEVVSERDGINEDLMFVTKIKKIFDGSQNVSEVTLSNRLLTQEQEDAKQRKDVEKFNESFQGDVVTINGGGYRAPVDDGLPYVFSIRKPDDVVAELTAELEIDALPYRAYSSGAASSGGSHEHTVGIIVPDHQHDFDIDLPEHQHGVDATADDGASNGKHTGTYTDGLSVAEDTKIDRSFELPDFGSSDMSFAIIYVGLSSADEDIQDAEVDIFEGAGQGDTLYNGDELPYFYTQTRFFQTIWPTAQNGESVDITFDFPDGGSWDWTYGAWAISEHDHSIDDTTADGGGTFQSSTTDDGGGTFVEDTTSNESGEHTHPPDPGVSEFGSETPSNVDVIVNGSTVASDVGGGDVIGSGDFTEVVDIGGALTEGFNTVEVTSDSLGHMRATAFLDVYRQITE